jgi:hypothetical protein
MAILQLNKLARWYRADSLNYGGRCGKGWEGIRGQCKRVARSFRGEKRAAVSGVNGSQALQRLADRAQKGKGQGDAKRQRVINTGAVNKILSNLRSEFEGRPGKDEKGVDRNHPGAAWNKETYNQHLDAYRKGGAAAVGAFIKQRELKNRGTSDRDWLTDHAIKNANLSALQKHADDVLQGKQPGTLKGVDGKIASILTQHIQDIKKGEFSESPQERDRQIEFVRKAISGNKFAAFVSKRIYDTESDDVAKAYADKVDWNEVGNAVSGRLKLADALRYEKS